MKEDFLRKLKHEADLRIPKEAPHLWDSIAPMLHEKSEQKHFAIFYYWKSIAASLIGLGILVFLMNQFGILDKKQPVASLKQEKTEEKLEKKPILEDEPTPAVTNEVAKIKQLPPPEPKSSVVSIAPKHENNLKDKAEISSKRSNKLEEVSAIGSTKKQSYEMKAADDFSKVATSGAPPSPVQNAKPMPMERAANPKPNKMNLVGNYIGVVNGNPYWAYIRGDEHAWTMKGNFGNNSASLHEIDANDQQLKFKQGDEKETFQYLSSDEKDRYYKNGTDTIKIQMTPNRLKIVLTRKEASENKSQQTWELMKSNE